MMKFFVLFLVFIVMVFGVYKLIVKNNALEKDIEKLGANLESLEKENRELLADIEYFEEPENLIKELKSQFNYREAGEKLIIVVPSTTPERD